MFLTFGGLAHLRVSRGDRVALVCLIHLTKELILQSHCQGLSWRYSFFSSERGQKRKIITRHKSYWSNPGYKQVIEKLVFCVKVKSTYGMLNRKTEVPFFLLKLWVAYRCRIQAPGNSSQQLLFCQNQSHGHRNIFVKITDFNNPSESVISFTRNNDSSSRSSSCEMAGFIRHLHIWP